MDEAEVAGTFTLLVDRPLSAVVRVAAWCPSMDLVALGTTDGQLSVRRLNWQVLWSATPGTGAATIGGSNAEGGSSDAVVWRPDGKALAVGGADGTVTVLDAEDGKQMMQKQLCAGVLSNDKQLACSSCMVQMQYSFSTTCKSRNPCSTDERS